MIEAAKVISLIQRTGSYNDKQYLLKKNEHITGLRDILRFIYDPYFKTGISSAKIAKALERSKMYDVNCDTFVSWQEIIKYLKKHNTGSDSDLAMAARFINCTKSLYDSAPSSFVEFSFVMELAKAIVTQDLQIGITAKTLNTVYGANFIPIVGCMLGKKIEDIPTQKIKWPCIVTEKLDGVRRMLIKEDGVCRLFSRSGHEDTGLSEIMAEAVYLPDNRMYDGELLAIGTFKDSVAQRQATNSLASTKGEKHGLYFNVFDMMSLDDFYNGQSEDTALTRKIVLAATFMDDSLQILNSTDWPQYLAAFGMHQDLTHVKSVPILGFVRSMLEVEPIVAEIWARGGEGVMLNTAEGYYEIKRSSSLIKVKHTEEFTLTVIDMLEGTGKYEDKLGALVVEYKGNKLGVGSGFTDWQRMQYWNAKGFYIGKQIEIDCFGESTNQQGTVSLNCPIFKRFVGEVE